MLWWLPLVVLFVGARYLAATALRVHPWWLPRTGSLGQRALVAGSGSLACLAALILLGLVANLLGGVARIGPPRVSSVGADSPAEHAGLVSGDEIVAVDSRPVATNEEVVHQIHRTLGRPFSIELRRGSAARAVVAQARLVQGRYRIGVTMEGSPTYPHQGLGPAVRDAVRLPVMLSAALLRSVTSTEPAARPRFEQVGPVGIVRLAHDSPSLGHLILYLIGPPLLLLAWLGLLGSVLALLVVRPHRSLQVHHPRSAAP